MMLSVGEVKSVGNECCALEGVDNNDNNNNNG